MYLLDWSQRWRLCFCAGHSLKRADQFPGGIEMTGARSRVLALDGPTLLVGTRMVAPYPWKGIDRIGFRSETLRRRCGDGRFYRQIGPHCWGLIPNLGICLRYVGRN